MPFPLGHVGGESNFRVESSHFCLSGLCLHLSAAKRASNTMRVVLAVFQLNTSNIQHFLLFSFLILTSSGLLTAPLYKKKTLHSVSNQHTYIYLPTSNTHLKMSKAHLPSDDIEEDSKDQDRLLPIANVARIMKKSLPESAKISKDAKEVVQGCVSEFITFITSEGKNVQVNRHDLLPRLVCSRFDTTFPSDIPQQDKGANKRIVRRSMATTYSLQ